MKLVFHRHENLSRLDGVGKSNSSKAWSPRAKADFWRLDRLDLVDEDLGYRVGWLQIAHIPDDRAQWLKDDMILFQAVTQGRFVGYLQHRFEKQGTWETLPPHQQADFGHVIVQALDTPEAAAWKKRKDWSSIPSDVLRQWEDRYDYARKNFLAYHAGKPMIDFVRVDPRHQKEGLGLKLYTEAARWMQEREMVLHGSTNQTPFAVRFWQTLPDRLPAGFSVDQEKSTDHPPRWMLRFNPELEHQIKTDSHAAKSSQKSHGR